MTVKTIADGRYRVERVLGEGAMAKVLLAHDAELGREVAVKLLDEGLAAVATGDSAFGAALDGGYWGIGLRTPDPAVFAGVPMSTARTGAVQRAQMGLLGLHPRVLVPLLDVDTFPDALAVAAQAPDTRFAAEVAALMMREAVAV